MTDVAQPVVKIQPAFSFTSSFTDAVSNDKSVLGGKGSGLVTMTQNGLNVPPGYILSTACCHEYLLGGVLPPRLVEEVLARLSALELETGKTFGAGPIPLLLSVRSGAPVSMPGMMDTVLNLGQNRAAAIALATLTGDTRFMADVLFRFHGMYSEIVLDVLDVPDRSELDVLLESLGQADAGVVYDAIWAYLQQKLNDLGEETVPDEPKEQLLRAIEAVFRSWNTRRAITYRELHRIPHEMGTAVVVQSMVFGNLDERSGSGVVFSRNPVTGEPGLFGEFLAASQGEDVVAGTRTPDPIEKLRQILPNVFADLTATVSRLETLERDVLDIEFTVERGILFLLQARSAKRTAPAAIRIASDFLDEGIVSEFAVLQMLSVDQVRQVQRPGFDPGELAVARDAGRCISQGIGASPGQVTGLLSLDPDRAVALAKTGQHVILARQVTSPTDLHGMIAAEGIVTATGGATSHAAVVARALGKSCVVGCSEISIDSVGFALHVGDLVIREGDPVSLDGATGEVFAGHLKLIQLAAVDRQLERLLHLSSMRSQAEVLARATTVEQVEEARVSGLAGVVASAADILTTSPRFIEVMESLRTPEDRPNTYATVEAVLFEQLERLFTAADGLEFAVRAIDFLVDEISDVVDSRTIAVDFPHLAMAVGSEQLISAQLRAVARALSSSGSTSPVSLSVRNVSDVAEARMLRKIHSDMVQAGWPGAEKVRLGIYLTSPRGVLGARQLAPESDLIWVELRLLQAAMFGLPPQHFLTREPLDRYSSRGLISVNPRDAIDPSVESLLKALPLTAGPDGETPVGIRISGQVSETLIGALYRLGFRRFAVDAGEAASARLALGRVPQNSD